MYAATELVHQNDLKLKQYGHQCQQSSDHDVRSNEHPQRYIKSAFTDQIWQWSPYFRVRLAYSLEYHQYQTDQRRKVLEKLSNFVRHSAALIIAPTSALASYPDKLIWPNLIIYSLGFSKYVNICKVECLPMP